MHIGYYMTAPYRQRHGHYTKRMQKDSQIFEAYLHYIRPRRNLDFLHTRRRKRGLTKTCKICNNDITTYVCCRQCRETNRILFFFNYSTVLRDQKEVIPSLPGL